MATTLNTIISRARKTLVEETVSATPFWTDAELLEHAINGCRDLWKGIVDVYQSEVVAAESGDPDGLLDRRVGLR